MFNIKQGFKRTISWNKYSDLDYLINPTFRKINRLFVLLFKKQKHKQEAYEKIIKMYRNDDYTTGNALDYLYHQNYY